MSEADTVRTSIIRETAQFLARIWMQHVRPMPYERVFYVDGVRVKIIVDEMHKEQEVNELMSDRSQDA